MAKMSESEKKKEDWMNSKWRPMMGWMYMSVCAFDFMLAPIMWSVLQSISHGSVQTQWQPLTLQGAGLFHVAMGAVLGIAAYGRTQEKLNGANNGGLGAGTTYVPPGSTGNVSVSNQPSFGGSSSGFNSSPSGFAAPSTPSTGFGAATGGFGSPAASTSTSGGGFGSASPAGFGTPTAAAPIAMSSTGKKVVPQQDDPIL
jgi:hypothetical protein